MISQSILIYLVKTILISGILIAYYWFALRNKKFHYYNRFYLLSASVISILTPIFNFDWFSIEEPVLYGSYEVLQYVLPASKSSFDDQLSWMDFILMGSVFIGIILLITLSIQVYKIQLLKKKSHVTPMDGFDFVNTKEENAPFSFFNNLFWKESISLQDEGGQQIFKHEITHIQQKHTWDRIYCQIIASIFWMNPFNWMIQKELMTIHEFIADEEAVGNANVEIFAKMLLQAHYGNHFLNPTHQFFYSSIKRRMLMLTTSKSIKYSYLRRLMVLPVFIVTICLVSIKVHAKEIIEEKVAAIKSQITVLMVDTVVPKNQKNLKLLNPSSTSIVSSNALNPLYYLNGIKMSEAEINAIAPDDIESVKVWKGDKAIEKYGIEGENGVVEITLKSTTSVKRIAVEAKNIPNGTLLYLVDGVPLKHIKNYAVDSIAPKDIESITIRKDPSVISLYGDKAKDGVVFITTKQGAKWGQQEKMPDETVINISKHKLSAIQQDGTTELKKVDKPALFPGGSKGWVDFLSKDLNQNILVSKGAPAGKYRVVLNFEVTNTGEVKNIVSLTNPGYGIEAEAIKMIQNGPKWIPAEKNGEKVHALVRQTITYAVTENE